jgi:hypothetical protein
MTKTEGKKKMIGISEMWRISPWTCALSDRERHLGHLISDKGAWVAFDGTRLDESTSSFRQLGRFTRLGEAMKAVERAAFLTPANAISASLH